MKLYFICVIVFFNILLNCTYQHPFVIIIPSYNNAFWYKKNLDSVFLQEYDNYRVIYIDDCSSDNTYQLVSDYIKACGQEHRVTLLCNDYRHGALYNHFKAVHMCNDDEIVINLDGDDWLAHEQVLQKINEIYQDPNVWMTYGSYINFPSLKKGKYCKEIPQKIKNLKAYREYLFASSHLRTFYAGLFKQIKLKDFLHKGRFISAACDVAFMVPLLELTHEHSRYIDEILYVYNEGNPEGHARRHFLLQTKLAYVTRARKRYNSLKKLPDGVGAQGVNCIIFSTNPHSLQLCLESLECCVNGLQEIAVLCLCNNDFKKLYEKIHNDFPHIIFYYLENGRELKPTFLETLKYNFNSFTLLCIDSCVVTDVVDINFCAKKMWQTHAYAFYLMLGTNIMNNPFMSRQQKQPQLIDLGDDILTWQFYNAEGNWRCIHNPCMILYRTDFIYSYLKDLVFDSIETLHQAWSCCLFDMQEVGLCFKTSKAGIMMNNTSTESNPDLFFDLFGSTHESIFL